MDMQNKVIKSNEENSQLTGTEKRREHNHEHKDPLTGTLGAHPIGTGLGAAGAGTAGAAIGALAGPVGALAGAAGGAVVGGLIGKGVAEGIDPTDDSAFWRENFTERAYYDQGFDYETHYEPAYRYGWESRKQYNDKSFSDMEPLLQANWEDARESSRLGWDQARHAVSDAWHRKGSDQARLENAKGE